MGPSNNPIKDMCNSLDRGHLLQLDPLRVIWYATFCLGFVQGVNNRRMQSGRPLWQAAGAGVTLAQPNSLNWCQGNYNTYEFSSLLPIVFKYSTVFSKMNFYLYFVRADYWALGIYGSAPWSLQPTCINFSKLMPILDTSVGITPPFITSW